MDVNTIIQLVTTLGFPIVCCIALFWRMIKSDENHKEEMEKLSEALNNNTLAINKVNERVHNGGNENCNQAGGQKQQHLPEKCPLEW